MQARLLVPLVAAIAVAGASSPAASAGSWTQPQPLTPTVQSAGGAFPGFAADRTGTVYSVARTNAGLSVSSAPRRGPVTTQQLAAVATSSDLAIAASGEGVAIWTQPKDPGDACAALYASRRPAGAAAFGPAQLLSTGCAYDYVYTPRVVIAPGGDATVCWSERPAAAGPGGRLVLKCAVGATAAGFGPPEQLSAPLIGIDELQLAGDEHGDTMVTWAARPLDSVRAVLEAATRRPGHPWDKARKIPGEANSDVDLSKLAVAPSGRAVVAWQRFHRRGQRALVGAATGTAGRGFGRAVVLSRVVGARVPRIAIEDGLPAAIVWREGRVERRFHVRCRLRVALLHASGSIRTTAPLVGRCVHDWGVAVNRRAGLTAHWSLLGPGHEQIATAPVGGGFTRPRTVTPSDTYPPMAALAVDGHDDTVLLVSRSWHPPAGLATRIEAFVRGPAAAIGHPVLLASSTSQTDVAGGRLLREPDGSVLAIWERTTSAGTGGNGPSERAEGSLYLP